MLSKDARYVAAAVQAVIAWEWLVSGANKILAGDFPQKLASTLDDGIKNNPNGWYVALLKQFILPHSVGFGYTIEFTEALIGIALLIGAVLLIGPVRRHGDPQYTLALVEMSAAAFAALVCAFLCVNFHFFMGNGVLPGIDVANAFNEGISLDTLMPPLSVIILYLNILALSDMTNFPLTTHMRRIAHRALALVGIVDSSATGATEHA